MVTTRESFLLRVWSGTREIQRVDIEHIQSGERERLDSLEAILPWMRRHVDRAPGAKEVSSNDGSVTPQGDVLRGSAE
jgi:hypothetical protein